MPLNSRANRTRQENGLPLNQYISHATKKYPLSSYLG